MSLRLEMLQAARLAPRLLGESTELVRAFLLGQQNADGGFKNRHGQSDLYYSVFGLEALLALECGSPQPLSLSQPPDQSNAEAFQLTGTKLESYLRAFGTGESLDLVHLCCLIRCWADVNTALNQAGRAVLSPPQMTRGKQKHFSPELGKIMPQRLETYRAKDGGYNPVPSSDFSTPYASFLAVGAYQDLQTWSADAHVRDAQDMPLHLPDPAALARCLTNLQNPNGSWDNAAPAATTAGATNATAAAVATLQQLSAPTKSTAAQWLLARSHPQGGFLAAPHAPLPDLLSTATALHALAGLQVPLEPIREKCLDFLDSLWTNQGSFHGHWLDDHLDCEYTYYGVLALGCLFKT